MLKSQMLEIAIIVTGSTNSTHLFHTNMWWDAFSEFCHAKNLVYILLNQTQ